MSRYSTNDAVTCPVVVAMLEEPCLFILCTNDAVTCPVVVAMLEEPRLFIL
jgi:hypothetical protein